MIISRIDIKVRTHVSMHLYSYSNVQCQREVCHPQDDFSRVHNARYCRRT